eukprot:TRINITY_DN28648_c0_g1_i1.p4 TRINITY_DN28648_c0_g1~~TRINITY_DN28648_c0_g1_i1.p4  ORF type:complete len:120 (-),score=20.01 TRINITY_DN28648_c0_g1_i1:822-1181(-)
MSEAELSQIRNHPDRLSERMHFLVRAAIPVAITLLIVGGLGLWILIDEKKESFISNSKFGEIYLIVHGINPMFTAIFVNGGLLLLIMSLAKLSKHNQAVIAAQTAEKEVAKQKESKKTK